MKKMLLLLLLGLKWNDELEVELIELKKICLESEEYSRLEVDKVINDQLQSK